MTSRKLLLSTLIASASLLICAQLKAQTLQQAIQYTMETNPDVLITANDRLATDQAVKVAQGGYWPTIDANAGYGRVRAFNPSTVNFINSTNYSYTTQSEAGFHLDQMLFDGFATSDEVARNKYRDASSAYRVAGTANDISLRVAQVYLAMLQQQEQANLAKQNLDTLQQIFTMIKQRTAAGIARSGDLVQAQSRLSLAKTNYQNALSNERDAVTDYLDVVGMQPEDLSDPFVDMDDLPTSLQAAIDQALICHPTLKSADQDVRAAEAQAAASHSNDFPRVDAQLGADMNNNVDGIPGPDNEFIAIVRAKYNLFKGGADLARERETAILVQEAMEVRNKTYRQVVRSTRLSWNALQTIEAQLPDLKSHATTAKQTVGIYHQQFMLGDRTLLDLLDAQNENFNANSAYLAGKYTDLFAKYRILNSMGILTKCVNVSLPPEAQLDDFS